MAHELTTPKLPTHTQRVLWSVHIETVVRAASLLWSVKRSRRPGIYFIGPWAHVKLVVGRENLHESYH